MVRLLPLLICASFAACSVDQPALVAEDIVVTRPIAASSMSAAYMSLRNSSDQPIRIDRVSSPDFDSVAMHESVLHDGIARMNALSEVVILPGDLLLFEPGGRHLMIRHRATPADAATLQFFDGDAMLLSIHVAIEK